jgi:hypothetical protein
MNRKVPNLQLGENTLLSFVTAASLGAEYVEFGKFAFCMPFRVVSYLSTDKTLIQFCF